MFCIYCGKELREDATYCSYCGKPTAWRSTESTLPETERLAPEEQPIAAPVYVPEEQPVAAPMHVPEEPAWQPEAAETKPSKPSGMYRMNTVHTFVSVPAEWQIEASPRTILEKQPAPEPKTNITADVVKEKAAHYSEVAKEKAVQVGTVAKEHAIKISETAKETAVKFGSAAKEQTKKLGATAKEKASEGVGKLKTAPVGKLEKNAFTAASLASLLSLPILLLTAFVPYCRIAYSEERAANMPLLKLIFGGTYTLGSSNPLQFTLKAHPELIALLLIPLCALLILFFRRAKQRLWIASGILFADGLAVVIWNRAALRQMQDIVSGLSLETFEKHVVSMNSVVVKWVQNVLQGNISFKNTFFMTGKLGHGLIGLFGWIAILAGVAGAAFCVILLFVRKSAKQTASSDTVKNEPDEDDDVPVLSGEWL